MKWVGFIVLLLISSLAWCHPRDSVKMAERKKMKIERERQQIMRKWDERTLQQRKTDRRVLIFLAISAGILANSVANKE